MYTHNMFQKSFYALVVTLVAANPAWAGFADLVTTYNFPATQFAMHPTRSHLYVTSSARNSVMIIDTSTLSLLDTIFIGSNPQGLAFSESGDRLFVANSGSSFIGVLDTNTYERLDSIQVRRNPYDLEMGRNGILYATPASGPYAGIMRIDTNTGKSLGEFSGGVFIYYGGLLQISPDRQKLYFGNRGLSPGTLAKYDVSTTSPTLEIRNPHGALGSNGQDVALSCSGDWITYAVGSGNRGYDIALIRTSDFAILGSFNTGPYPREVQFSPDDEILYAVHTAGHIDVWDTGTFLPLPSINTGYRNEANELFVNPSWNYLFAAVGNELRVYDTGRFIPEPGTVLLLGLGGVMLRKKSKIKH